jgi:hypothetical protein
VGERSQVPEDDPTKRAGEQPYPTGVPVVAPENDDAQPAPARRSRIPRHWHLWVAIVAVAAMALAIALVLALGGSSSSAGPTPSAAVNGAITGSYLTTTVQDSRLAFASLVETGKAVSGSLTVTISGPAHKHLVAHLYTVSGMISGSILTLDLTPTAGTGAPLSLTATFASGTITATLGGGSTLTLTRGTLAAYRLLVRHDRSALLLS